MTINVQVTPLQLGILLHYCTQRERHPMLGVDAYMDGVDVLEALGLLSVEVGEEVTATDMGRAWILAACRTELPRLVWVDEHQRELIAASAAKEPQP